MTTTLLSRPARAALLGLLAGVSLSSLALGAPSHALDPQPAPATVSASAPAPSGLADIVARVSPSVVQIMVRQGSAVQRVQGPQSFDDLPPQDLTRVVADTQPGQSRDVQVWRNGRERTIKVRIEALETPAALNIAPAVRDAKVSLNGGLGLEVVEDTEGLLVAAVAPNSPAQEAGLRAGDRLLAVGGTDLKTVREAQEAVRAARSQGRAAVLVQIQRNTARLFLGVPFQNS